jgi:hypothetical protein
VNIKKTTKVCEDMKIAFEDDEQYIMPEMTDGVEK